MGTAEPGHAGRAATPLWLRIVFGLAAFGLTVQWFDRLGQLIAGKLAGWSMVWNLIALGFLPLGVVYFACRAVLPDPRGAVPGPARDAGHDRSA